MVPATGNDAGFSRRGKAFAHRSFAIWERDMIEFTDRWLLRLYAAQRDLIDEYGGCRRVVEKLSISRSQVGRWYGGVDRDTIPLPLVMTMEGECGRSPVTDVMNEFLGRDVGAPETAVSNLSALNAELVEITGRMMVETVRAKADGVVTANEAIQLRELSRRAEQIRAEIDDILAGVEAAGSLRVVGS
jgi:hypothetical protein